ncbi:MAG: hypothetical protein V8R85_09840 [Frisingicoccus sp.]
MDDLSNVFDKVQEVDFETMEQSYIEYAMSVMLEDIANDRQLGANAERRILYAMNEVE